MVLYNVSLPGKEGLWHVHIRNGKINTITGNKEAQDYHAEEDALDLDGAILLPGFINSHDHLDFNLFPGLGSNKYNNYREWGLDIHTTNKEVIADVLKVPQRLRVKWGLYKNLLNGFTTVVNHGEKLDIEDEFISVIQDCYQLHSTAFEKNWKWKLNNPFKRGKPFVMHLGEGIDEATTGEIENVIRMNLLRKKIIAVHGVAMNEKQAAAFAGLIWCPASNYFLFNKTAEITKLKNKIKIAFGTDSTLTSSWNVWEQFREALHSDMVSNDELLAMLTTVPAALWGLADTGDIKQTNKADLIVVKKSENIFNCNPEDILVVVQNGNIRVIDDEIAGQLINYPFDDFSRIQFNNAIKRVQGNLPGLVREIKKIFPAAYIPFIIADA